MDRRTLETNIGIVIAIIGCLTSVLVGSIWGLTSMLVVYAAGLMLGVTVVAVATFRPRAEHV